jgi:hypothetical protein
MAGEQRYINEFPELYLDEKSVFLNIPYEKPPREKREPVLRALGYIAGLTAVGLRPVMASELEYSYKGNFAENVIRIMRNCDYSVHHLSAHKQNNTLELGMAYAIKATKGNHAILVMADDSREFKTILSDWQGMVMDDLSSPTPDGDGMMNICRAVRNAFKRELDADQFRVLYACLKAHALPETSRKAGHSTFYKLDLFDDLLDWARLRWQLISDHCDGQSATECPGFARTPERPNASYA